MLSLCEPARLQLTPAANNLQNFAMDRSDFTKNVKLELLRWNHCVWESWAAFISVDFEVARTNSLGFELLCVDLDDYEFDYVINHYGDSAHDGDQVFNIGNVFYEVHLFICQEKVCPKQHGDFFISPILTAVSGYIEFHPIQVTNINWIRLNIMKDSLMFYWHHRPSVSCETKNVWANEVVIVANRINEQLEPWVRYDFGGSHRVNCFFSELTSFLKHHQFEVEQIQKFLELSFVAASPQFWVAGGDVYMEGWLRVGFSEILYVVILVGQTNLIKAQKLVLADFQFLNWVKCVSSLNEVLLRTQP